PIHDLLKKTRCQRAVLVGHNAWFDLLFIKAAIKRTGIKSPFHAFTCFDTATLAGLIFGETVLAKAVQAAGLHFDSQEAHSAIYDAEKTADLFCLMINKWRMLNI
ncbi:TPA: ribonuclease T, partial [Legionella pneumophila]|nr:ribonuclease T [Legionella pneumophila]HBI2921965.1 ribonuclease T [Legionella pneumophila]